MLPIYWLESAEADIVDIIEYIAQFNVAAAELMWNLLRDSVLPLSHQPYLYRQSERIPDLREIVVHPNYIVLYRVNENSVEIVNIVHARRQFPSS